MKLAADRDVRTEAVARPTPVSETRAPILRVEGLGKRFGGLRVVDGVSLDVAQGSFVALLGPSGCGKTTTLRMIAGLEQPSEGTIVLEGRRLNDVSIHRRNLGLVFQNYALFPHMTVLENIGFGLRFAGRSRSDLAANVRRMLDLVRLPHVEDRYPSQLSGGQQQRVALARALIVNPTLLLLDEPLSALDANLREEMRNEISRIQQTTGVTTLFVTHDQSEALSLSDSVVIMQGGRVVQHDTPNAVYERPASRFVADFLGRANLLAGEIVGRERGRLHVRLTCGACLDLPDDRAPAGPRVLLVARGEHMRVRRGTNDNGGIRASVKRAEYLGSRVLLHLEAPNGTTFVVSTVPRADDFATGDAVVVDIDVARASLVADA